MALNINSRTPPLVSVQAVGIEISRIYRRTKRGEIDTADGYRLVQMLAVLKNCLETAAFEQRMTDIEAAIAARNSPNRPSLKVA
jgi:hypothetical protein